MWKVIAAGLWAHKRRLSGTGIAVVLGVAFLAGTLVLGDSMRAGFDELFTTANAGTDAVVRDQTELGSEQALQRGSVDESLVDVIADVDGVATAVPQVEGRAQIIGSDGDPLGGDGPPTVGGNWILEPDLNPWLIASGRAPEGPGEVVIDRASARTGGLAVGDSAVVLTPEPVDVSVVGIATLGRSDSISGRTFTAFATEEAQRLLMPAPDRVTEVLVAASPGVSETELVSRLQPVLPDGLEAITGTALTAEDNAAIESDFLGFFETFLLVFAAVALLVAAFSIYNTFSIVIAQRTRQQALLRAIGASRAQTLLSIAAEALVVGAIASAIGLAAGVGLALLLTMLLDAMGLALPSTGPVLQGATAVVSITVGVVMTLVAAFAPAVRASRTPPMAALRDVAAEPAGASAVRAVVGVLITGGGVLAVLAGIAADGDGLGLTGLGALATLVGAVVLGPVVARPVAAMLGAPLPLLRRITGRLARQNAMRNPRRTAATASALMVGIGVVTLFTVFASSVKAAIDDSVQSSFRGDLVIASQSFSGAGLSPQLAVDIDALDDVASATGIGEAALVVDGSTRTPTVVDPAALAPILDIGVVEGSLEDLADGQVAVSDTAAEEAGWSLGQTLPVEFADGSTGELTIGALYVSSEIVGEMLLPAATWAPHATQRFDVAVVVELAEGVDQAQGEQAVQAVADRYRAPDVQDRHEYVATVAGEIDQSLGVIYGMLALAILIALMGIANTLSLSMHERTRELGLLRAVGQRRSQTRSMVRWESVLVALFGTVGGIAVGVFLGWALLRVTAAAEDFTAPLALPVAPLVAVLAVGVVIGVVAAVRPARRAARLDVLAAIANE